MKGPARRLALLPVLLAVLASGLPALVAPAPARGQESFDDSLAVSVVEVPVQVLSDGGPVTGLTAADFEIYDEGRRREVASFEVIDFASGEARPGGEGAGAAQAPPRQRRNLLLLFDFTFSEPGRLARARKAAEEMARRQLGPRDRAAVAVYGDPAGVRVLTGLTDDRRALALALGVVEAALDRKPRAERAAREALHRHLHGEPQPGEAPPEGDGELLARSLGPQGALALEGALMMPSVEGNGLITGAGPKEGDSRIGGAGVDSGTAPAGLGALGMVVANEASELAGHSLSQVELAAVQSLARGLGELASLLAPVEGQNHLVLFSEGFSDRYLRGDIGVQSATRELRAMTETFRWAQWSIHAVDVRGLRPREAGGPEVGGIAGFVGGPGTASGPAASSFGGDALLALAEQTGGELYESFNRLEAATAQVLERTRVTYLLTFLPEGVEANGGYRALEVKVKGAGLGARVVHRPGYYAPGPASLPAVPSASPGADPVLRADRDAEDRRHRAIEDELLGSAERSELSALVLAAPLPAAGSAEAASGPRRVPLLVEVPGGQLEAAAAGSPAGSDGAELPLRLQVYALGDDGSIAGFLARELRFDRQSLGERIGRGGVRLYGELELPPGSYRLRVKVDAGSDERVSLGTVPLVVEGQPGSIELLPPLFLDGGGDWVMARASGGGAEGGAVPAYPFTFAGRETMPALAPEVSEGDTVPVLLLARVPAGESVSLSTRVLGEDGEEAGGGSFELEPAPEADPDGYARRLAHFAPDDMAPGDYQLEITLTDQATGDRAVQRAGFRVRGEEE